MRIKVTIESDVWAIDTKHPIRKCEMNLNGEQLTRLLYQYGDWDRNHVIDNFKSHGLEHFNKCVDDEIAFFDNPFVTRKSVK